MHLDIIHRVLVVYSLLFGLSVLYVTWFTNAFIDRRRIYALSKSEQAKAVPLRVGLITALGMVCVAFAIDVLFVRQGLFR